MKSKIFRTVADESQAMASDIGSATGKVYRSHLVRKIVLGFLALSVIGGLLTYGVLHELGKRERALLEARFEQYLARQAEKRTKEEASLQAARQRLITAHANDPFGCRAAETKRYPGALTDAHMRVNLERDIQRCLEFSRAAWKTNEAYIDFLFPSAKKGK